MPSSFSLYEGLVLMLVMAVVLSATYFSFVKDRARLIARRTRPLD